LKGKWLTLGRTNHLKSRSQAIEFHEISFPISVYVGCKIRQSAVPMGEVEFLERGGERSITISQHELDVALLRNQILLKGSNIWIAVTVEVGNKTSQRFNSVSPAWKGRLSGVGRISILEDKTPVRLRKVNPKDRGGVILKRISLNQICSAVVVEIGCGEKECRISKAEIDSRHWNSVPGSLEGAVTIAKKFLIALGDKDIQLAITVEIAGQRTLRSCARWLGSKGDKGAIAIAQEGSDGTTHHREVKLAITIKIAYDHGAWHAGNWRDRRRSKVS
jgi:hypothetical protein